MGAPLNPSLHIQAIAEASPATIRVKNLQSSIQGPHDAWGRPNRPQPVSISASVSLPEPFGSSSSTDAVSSDTVHYGLLSKAVLASLARVTNAGSPEAVHVTLRSVLENIWVDLTGHSVAGTPALPADRKEFLSVSAIAFLTVTVHLPKASLLGNGVSLTGCAAFSLDGPAPPVQKRGITLRIHDLRVPTLIGVNENERKAKQVVVANLEVDRFDDSEDGFCELEALIVETMSNSSYETLEALATELIGGVARHLVNNHGAHQDVSGWQIKISLEKPVAVPSAEAACVELSMNTNEIAPS